MSSASCLRRARLDALDVEVFPPVQKAGSVRGWLTASVLVASIAKTGKQDGHGQMAKRRGDPSESARAREFLRKYECPVPFHEVRTRFLGNIASPNPVASPIQTVKDLWGGELPTFASQEDVNDLIGSLVNGLWNSLTRHQKRSEPFRLVSVKGGADQEALAHLGRIRRQEIDGFVEGLFQGAEEIDLPPKASSALDALAEIQALFAGLAELPVEASDPEDESEVQATFRNVKELERAAAREMHSLVLECSRARRANMRNERTVH